MAAKFVNKELIMHISNKKAEVGEYGINLKDNQIYLNCKDTTKRFRPLYEFNLYALSKETLEYGDHACDTYSEDHFIGIILKEEFILGETFYLLCDDKKKRLVANNDCKKVIASSDKTLGLPIISESYVDKFILEYNKGNRITRIQIETPDESELIDIKIIEPKESWSKNEIIDIIKNFAEEFVANTQTAYTKHNIDKWIRKNL